MKQFALSEQPMTYQLALRIENLMKMYTREEVLFVIRFAQEHADVIDHQLECEPTERDNTYRLVVNVQQMKEYFGFGRINTYINTIYSDVTLNQEAV